MTTPIKNLDDNGLLYFWQKLKAKFVAQEAGKGLSTNDYTTAEKNKLDGIEDGAEENIIETVKVNGTALTPDANKTVDVAVPTKTSDLTNDDNFQENTIDTVKVNGIWKNAADVLVKVGGVWKRSDSSLFFVLNSSALDGGDALQFNATSHVFVKVNGVWQKISRLFRLNYSELNGEDILS